MNQSAMALIQPPKIEEADGPRSAIADWEVTRIQIAEGKGGGPLFWRPAADGPLLVVGRPASGKTMTLQNVATQFAREHWAVHVAARRAAEYHDFTYWPNVCCVATATREHAALIHHLFTLMRCRQNSGNRQCAPVVVIIDALPEVIGALAEADSAAVGELELLLGFGREVKIHVAAAADMTVVGSLVYPSGVPAPMAERFSERLVLNEAPTSARLANRNLGELKPSRRSYPEIHLNELTTRRDGGAVAPSQPSRWLLRILAWVDCLRPRRRSQQRSPKGHQDG